MWFGQWFRMYMPDMIWSIVYRQNDMDYERIYINTLSSSYLAHLRQSLYALQTVSSSSTGFP